MSLCETVNLMLFFESSYDKKVRHIVKVKANQENVSIDASI